MSESKDTRGRKRKMMKTCRMRMSVWVKFAE